MTLHARFVSIALFAAPLAARADEFKPAAPADIPGYFAEVMPCAVERDGRVVVSCKGKLLEKKTLRELSIARNTIYARYGWDGYRKPWLREHFHAQPWFKPNPRFTYKVLSDADRKNAHLIATREQSLTDQELRRMRDDIYAHYGKIWHDRDGIDCKDIDIAENSNDCHYRHEKGYRPNPKFDEGQISPVDKIELGLISRALGSFALDDDARERKESGLDQALPVSGLRQLSLRDLRILRNSIYARKGRPFKSQIVREHFEGMSWYQVDPAYSDAKLSAVDNRNIALIKSVENEFGGPLKDEDYLTEPAMDGA